MKKRTTETCGFGAKNMWLRQLAFVPTPHPQPGSIQRQVGVEPAASTSRNPLESLWLLGEEEFTRRMKTSEVWKAYKSAREETMSVTEEIVRVEKEIDEQVKALYGL